jgi:hypothetical protein
MLRFRRNTRRVVTSPKGRARTLIGFVVCTPLCMPSQHPVAFCLQQVTRQLLERCHSRGYCRGPLSKTSGQLLFQLLK